MENVDRLNKFVVGWRYLFSRKCPYHDCCSIYKIGHFACDEKTGSWCGVCRSFDNVGKDCTHYVERERKVK